MTPPEPYPRPRLQLQEKHFSSFYKSAPVAVGCESTKERARASPTSQNPPPHGTCAIAKNHDVVRDDRSPMAESGTCKEPRTPLSFLHSCSSHPPTHTNTYTHHKSAELPRERTESLLLQPLPTLTFPALSAGTTTCTLVHSPLTTSPGSL